LDTSVRVHPLFGIVDSWSTIFTITSLFPLLQSSYSSLHILMAMNALQWSAGALFVALVLLCQQTTAAKPVLEGPARVVDGDTIYIGEPAQH
jgi:hypothetical protein